MQAAGKPLKVLVVDELFSEHHPRANGSMACIEVLPGALPCECSLLSVVEFSRSHRYLGNLR